MSHGATRNISRPPAPCSTPINRPPARSRCRWRRISRQRSPVPIARSARHRPGLAATRPRPDPPGPGRRRRVKSGSSYSIAWMTTTSSSRCSPEVHSDFRPDYLVYANRLFDPDRVFEGQRRRRLWRTRPERPQPPAAVRLAAARHGADRQPPLEISATGDISSGRIAVEYALRGCTSFQIHTLFQLPASKYAMRVGTRVQKALHRLYFDPERALSSGCSMPRSDWTGCDGPVRLLDWPAAGRRQP